MSAAGLPELPDAPVKKGGGIDLPDAPKKVSGAGSPHDFTKGYKPSSQDISTKQSFDNLENSFDKPKKTIDWDAALSYMKKTSPENDRQVVHDQLKTIFPNIDKHTPSKSAGQILGEYGKGFVGAFNSKLGDITQAVNNLVKSSSIDPASKITYGDGLDAATKWLKGKAGEKSNPLPNNILGNIVSGLGKTVPTALGAYATGGASLEPEGAALTGSYLSNSQIVQQGLNESLSPITKYMAGEGALMGAGDAAKDHKNVLGGAVSGATEGFEQGVLLHGSMKSGDFLGSKLFDVAKKSGIVDESGKFTEQALKSIVGTPVSFATASVADDVAHGKPIDWKKALVQGASALPFEVPHLADAIHTNKVINFLSAEPEDISRVADSKVSPSELEIGSIKAGMDAEKPENSDDENTLRLKQIALKHDADIKENVDAILKDKDGYIQSVQQSNVSDEVKQQMIDKVNQVYKDNEPNEKKKGELGSKIADLDEKIKTYSEKTEDPVKNAGNEVNLEQAKKDREELNNNLKQLIVKQNESKKEGQVDNGSPKQEPDNQGGQESINGRQVAERPEETSDGSQNVTTPEVNDEKGNVLTQSGEASAEPDLKKSDNEQDKIPVTPKNETAKSEKDDTGNEANGGKDVKKTILTKRAYEGTVSEDVKKHLEEKGLTRKSFSPQERSQQATDFIKKFGDDAAVMAVKTGDVEGGLASSILTQLQIKNNRLMSELDPESEEYQKLAKETADLINTAENKGYSSGEFVGQLAYEYQNAELNYANIKRQVEKATGKKLSDKMEKKVKDLSDQNEKLKKQLLDSESKLIDETERAFKSGYDEHKNETKTQKAKRVADKIRSLKIQTVNDATLGIPIALYNGALEISATTLEAGGKLSDAIDKGLKHLRESDFYNKLSDNKRNELEDKFKSDHYETAGSTDLDDLQARFVDKKGNKFTPSEARDIWGYIKQTYLDNGTSYRDAISKSAQDLGLTWRQVSEAIVTPKTKRMTDELWKKQYDYSRYRTAIKGWIGDQTNSTAMSLYKNVSGTLRGTMVFGHGAIFSGTHAGMTFFSPATFTKSVNAFLNGWRFAYGNEGRYQMAMEELKNSPNYLIAQRAGLKNDPDRLDVEEYQKSQQYLEKIGMGKIAHSGERGFNAIKVLRQNLFDYHFDKLTAAEREDPEVAKSIAKLMNLATGATTADLSGSLGRAYQEATFAGGMEAARWQKLLQSPVKATGTAIKAITHPNDVSPADKVFAKVWAQRVGLQLATYMTARALNAAINNYVSNKKEKVLDPTDPNWWKFKFPLNTEVDPTSGMRGTAKFIYDIGNIPFEVPKGGEDRIKTLSKDAGQYAKGKVSPFYTDLSEIYSSRDFTGNTVPWSNEEPSKGHHKMTGAEYAWSKAPLPLAEAAATAYKSATDNGADKMELKHVLRGIFTGALSGSTGFRVGETNATEKQSDFDKKMSTVTLKRADSTDEHIKLTPDLLKKRNDIYEGLKKNVPEGGTSTIEQTYKQVYDNEYNTPKNKAKRADRRALWKNKGLSDGWIDKKEKELKKDEKDKFVEKKLIDLSGELVTPDAMKQSKKNKFSIK